MVIMNPIETLKLWTSPKTLWIEAPAAPNRNLPVVAIHRTADCIKVQLTEPSSISTVAVRKTIHGVLGIAELPLGAYLIVIAQRRNVGNFDGQPVYRLVTAECIPIWGKAATSSKEAEAHRYCLNLLQDTLGTPYFYFSYTGDLTNNAERHARVAQDHGNRDAWSCADDRFLWNFHLANTLLQFAPEASRSSISQFLTHLVHGAVFIHRCSINGKMFHWSLISRRSRFQTGSRFFSRGCDPKGNVSNFCETEQIVEYNGQLASYVQTRGSMPFYWSQRPCIKYMPKPIVTGSNEQNRTAMSTHFHEQMDLYGELVLVNLINQKKNEGMLEQTFRDLVAKVALQGVNYEAFDFHKECSKMRYDRLSLLSEQLSNYKFGYFLKTRESGKILQKQKGVFRTNCMDCLDRTNVVQAFLAAENLATILSSWGILNTDSVQELEQNCDFQSIYRNSWADHANLISVQYAGTGALKTDYTRTGVRTHWGLLQDGWNASIRYIKNNFKDGQRTDGVKFLLGELSPRDVLSVQTLQHDQEPSMISYLPHIMMTILGVLVMTLMLSPRLSFSTIIFCGFCGILLYLFSRLMISNSDQFVNFPSLFLLNRRQ